MGYSAQMELKDLKNRLKTIVAESPRGRPLQTNKTKYKPA